MRTLTLETPIAELYTEYTYTLVRLKAHRLTSSLVTDFAPLEEQLRQLLLREVALIQAQAQGDALIDVADDDLDALHFLITSTVVALSANDRNHPLYLRFFGSERPSDMRRPILGEQLATMRTWLPTLKSAPQPTLQAYTAPLDDIVSRADAAVAARAQAEQALIDFNTIGDRKRFIDAFNATRSRMFGQLGEIRHKNPDANLPIDFADRFFRREKSTSRPTIAGQEKVIVRLEQQLLRQKEILAALVQQQTDSERIRAEAEAAMLRQELEAVEEEARQKAARAAELRARLEGKSE